MGQGAAAYRALAEQHYRYADELRTAWIDEVEHELPLRWRKLSALPTRASWSRSVSSSGSSRRSRCSPRSSSASRARRPAAAAACGCCATSCRKPTSTARARRRERRRLPLAGHALSPVLDRRDALPVRRPHLRARAAADRGPPARGGRDRGRSPHCGRLGAEPALAPRRQLGRPPPAQATAPDRRRCRPGARAGERARRSSTPSRWGSSSSSRSSPARGRCSSRPAYPPFFVALVPRESYLDANSKLSASRSVSFVAGPAVGGALVQLFSARRRPRRRGDVPLLRVPDRPRRRRGAPTRHGGELAPEPRPRGLGLVVRHPVLRAGLGCATTINFFTFMVSALVILFASRTLGLSAGVIGLAFGIGALGGVVGAVLAPRLAGRFGVGRVIVAGAILFPAPLALLALAGGPTWAAATVLAVVEFVSARRDVLRRQPELAPDERHPGRGPQPCRGRVQHDQLRHPAARRDRRRAPRDVCGRARDARARRDRGTLSILWLLPSPIPSVRSLEARASARTAGRRRARARG